MTVLDIVVRLSNALVTVLGLTLLSYGGYLAATCKVIANPVTEASLGLGVIDMVFGLLVLTCGYRNLFILRLYGLIMSILVVAEFVLAVLFLTNNSIVISNSNTCGGDKAMSLAKTNLSWIILAVAACQTVTLVIVFLQVCNVDKPFDESQYNEEGLLSRGEQYGALADDGAPMPSAQERYKQKHSSFYAKYGLK